MASFGGLWRRKQNWFTRLGKKEIGSGSYRGTSVRPWLEFLEGRALPAIFWDGGGSNSHWETAANWSNDQVPTSTDDVEIGGAIPVELSSGTTVASLRISGGAALNLTDSLRVSGAVRLTESYGSTPGTVRGVSDGVELVAGGGLYFQAGVTLDHLTVKIPEGAEAEVAFATFVTISNGARLENAGTLKMNGYCGLVDDGTGTLVNAETGRIEATSYYQYFNNLQFATVANVGTIHAAEGAHLGLGGSGQRVVNRGSITGDINSEIDFADGLDQDSNTGVVETAGSVTFYHTGDQEIAGTYSAAATLVYGDLNLAFTGAVEHLGNLSVAGGATVDLTGAAFGAEGRTLSSLTISGGGLLVTDESLTVEGQVQLTGSYGNMPGTVRGVGNGVELVAAGGLYLQAGVNLDHLTVKIPEGAEAEMAFATFVTISNGTRVENAGTLKMNGYCGLIDDGTGTLENTATGRISATSYYQYFNNLQFATVTNAGEIHAGEGAFLGLGGSGQRVINRASITGDANSEIDFADGLDQDPNTGVVETAGRVTFYYTGDQEIAGTFSAAGTLVYGDLNLAFTGAVERLGNLSVAGGATVDLTGAAFGAEGRILSSLTLSSGGILITDENLTVEGPFNWDHGTLQGNMGLGSLTVQSDLTLSGTYTVRDFNLINAGDAVWSGGSVLFEGVSRFTNLPEATFDDRIDGAFGGVDTCPIFDNQGLFRKSGGPGTTLLHMQLYNSGSVIIEQGTLNIHCGYVQVVNNDGSGGEIGGDFTGDVSVYNPGEITVDPDDSGNPPHSVSNYVQGATGNLTERIGGLTPGTQYGQIVVNGNVSLNGTLRVELINGFVPPVGSPFTVIDNRGANPIAGTFTGLPEGATVLSGPHRFTVSYVGGDGNDLVLTYTGMALTELTGRMFDDLDNDGLFGANESGIANVAVRLIDSHNLTVATTTTAADGSYLFRGLFSPGTYRVEVTLATGYLDGKETAGSLGGTVQNQQESSAIADILMAAGSAGTGYNFAFLRPSKLEALVWEDLSNDGVVNTGENAIPSVAVLLNGYDDRGNPISIALQTNTLGKVEFINLRPGTYSLIETQPQGYTDGKDLIGTVNNVASGNASQNDRLQQIVLAQPDSLATNYRFGELPTSRGPVSAGETAGIGFWQNKHGQDLIKSLNGGANGTQLGTWLAATFPNLYGAQAGSNSLAGKSNTQIAAIYVSLFKQQGIAALSSPGKLDAQVMATAFAVYVTNQSLAGTVAVSYGFKVSASGVGAAAVNIGNRGEAFGVANGTTMTVLEVLGNIDAHTVRGIIYDLDGSGTISNTEKKLRTQFNDVVGQINEMGGI